MADMSSRAATRAGSRSLRIWMAANADAPCASTKPKAPSTCSRTIHGYQSMPGPPLRAVAWPATDSSAGVVGASSTRASAIARRATAIPRPSTMNALIGCRAAIHGMSSPRQRQQRLHEGQHEQDGAHHDRLAPGAGRPRQDQRHDRHQRQRVAEVDMRLHALPAEPGDARGRPGRSARPCRSRTGRPRQRTGSARSASGQPPTAAGFGSPRTGQRGLMRSVRSGARWPAGHRFLGRLPVEVAGEQAVDDADLVGEVDAEAPATGCRSQSSASG